MASDYHISRSRAFFRGMILGAVCAWIVVGVALMGRV